MTQPGREPTFHSLSIEEVIEHGDQAILDAVADITSVEIAALSEDRRIALQAAIVEIFELSVSAIFGEEVPKDEDGALALLISTYRLLPEGANRDTVTSALCSLAEAAEQLEH